MGVQSASIIVVLFFAYSEAEMTRTWSISLSFLGKVVTVIPARKKNSSSAQYQRNAEKVDERDGEEQIRK